MGILLENIACGNAELYCVIHSNGPVILHQIGPGQETYQYITASNITTELNQHLSNSL